jgi:hypothetical protein
VDDAADATARRPGDSLDPASQHVDWGELIARLTFTYKGVSPEQWLMTIPSAITRACALMAPRLAAESAMAHANEIAFGSGHLTKDGMNLLRAAWQREADGSSLTQTERPAAGVNILQQQGIPIRFVVKAKTDA